MANNALIQGEAALRKTQGFVDYGAKLKPAMEAQRNANVKAKREKELKVEASESLVPRMSGAPLRPLSEIPNVPFECQVQRSFDVHE